VRSPILSHDLSSPEAVYGLNHFLFKYGIEVSIVGGPQAVIRITNGSSDDNLYPVVVHVRRSSGELQQRIMGYLKGGTTKVPLFEVPRRSSAKTGVVAVFEAEGESYPCLVRSDGRLDVGFDIFGTIGYLLSGHLDSSVSECGDVWSEMLKIPVVDILEKLLFESLESLCKEKGIDVQAKPLWPNGKTFALCLTHDVDRVYKTYQYLPSVLGNLRRGDVGGLAREIFSMLFRHGKKNPYWTFDTIARLENDLGVKSTFFFLNESGRLNPLSWKSWILFGGRYSIESRSVSALIRELRGGGFEIGVHGSYRSYKDAGLLSSEREQLERVIGEQIAGVRQHYLNHDESTFALQQSAGFLYDTTVGFRQGVGFRTGTCYPYYPFDVGTRRELTLLEIPLVIMDAALPRDGTMLDECMELMDVVSRNNGILSVLWHPGQFSESDHPGMMETYRKLVAEGLDRGACVMTAGDVCTWVKDRRSLQVTQ